MRVPEKKNISVLIFAILISVTAVGQNSPLKFGKIEPSDFEISEFQLDSSAGAIVILEFGETTFDHDFRIVLENHIRIKILNSSEFDRANVTIPMSVKDDIKGLKASTFNLVNGKVIESEVNRKDVFTESVTDEVKQVKFTFPEVKEGSIIDYVYTINYGTWSSLNTWYFQRSIPILHSEYKVSLPEYFNYIKTQSGYVVPLDYSRSIESGYYKQAEFSLNVEKFIAKNVPAFKVEPYISSQADYISKIKFELAGTRFPNTFVETYIHSTHAQLSKEYAEGEIYGKRLLQNNFLDEDIEKATQGATTNEEKIANIYRFVRDNYEVDLTVMAEGLRRLHSLRKAYPYEINCLLIAMYNQAGFEAKPVMLSTVENGKINPTHPIPRNFNQTICLVKDGEKEYLLDASKKHLPFNVLDKSSLNGSGMVITTDNFRWVELKPNIKNIQAIYSNLELDENGKLQGSVKKTLTGYEAITFRKNHSLKLKEYQEDFANKFSNWEIQEHEITGVDEIEKPILENISFETDNIAESMGEIIFFNPIPIGQTKDNPFKSDERLFPIYFGTPIEEVIVNRIKIPEGYILDSAPEQMGVALPDNGGSFIYSVQHVGDYITLSSKISINNVEFQPEQYFYLKEFFSQIISKQAEQIVLKKEL
ncbi:DUF3857 domain-containing protein [Peijinzhouia sedimentorum]